MLWDIAGNMMSKTLYNNYLKGAHGVFLVCDAMRPETYSSILQERNQHLNSDFKQTQSYIIVNKSDLIPADDPNYLDGYEYDFLTSAKSGDQVEEAFQKMAEQLLINAGMWTKFILT